MKKVICYLFVVFFALKLDAQDIHFSQYFMSPLTLNPALTASFNGKYRVAANYRNQWWKITDNFGTPTFHTYSGSFDMVIPTGSWDNSRVGIGLTVFGDRAGNGALTTNSAMLSIAYHRAVDRFGKHVLSLGLQGGIVSKRVFINDLVFESQLEDLGFNTNLPNGEVGNAGKPIIYPDFNLGALWRSMPADRFRYSIGFSLFHVARPKESLLNNADNRLAPRYVAHASAEFDVSDYFTITPSFLFMYQAAAQEYVGGIGIKYALTDEFKVTAGAYYRYNDAAIPVIGIKWKGLQAGVSYDVNISGLRAATKTQGSLEVSAIYIFGEDDRRRADENYCPSF
jgi:type IX secretion system PorP/SprF family membrane protein